MNLDVHFIGTGGSVPQAKRGLPATALHYGGEWLLFDCGEGTQRQLLQSVGLKQFDRIYITHMHTDHWLGLPSMLLTWTLLGRAKPLYICGPQALRQRIESLADLKPSYPIHFGSHRSAVITVTPDYSVTSFEVEHGGDARGFVFAEATRPGTFDPKAAAAAGFGPASFGPLKAEGAFTGLPKPGRKVVFAGDTRPCASVVDAARGADLFITEASFLEEDGARAKRAKHSTAREAGNIAKEAGVKRLYLNHILTRTSKTAAEEEARSVFAGFDIIPRTRVPFDFDTISIPARKD